MPRDLAIVQYADTALPQPVQPRADQLFALGAAVPGFRALRLRGQRSCNSSDSAAGCDAFAPELLPSLELSARGATGNVPLGVVR